MPIDVIEAIRQVGGYYNDPGLHFVYKSGKHGQAYLNMDPLFPHVHTMHQLCVELGRPIRSRASVVVGAATGGIPLATLVGFLEDIRFSVWADKVDDDFEFEREGYADCVYGEDVWYVEDILNTGDTTRKVIDLIRRAGGNLIGASVACNRGGLTGDDLGVPELHELSSISLDAYDSASCPQCAAEVPVVTDIGHGDKFQRLNPEYGGKFIQLRAA